MSADRLAGARRTALATFSCLALLGSTLPAPSLVLADSPAGLHQTGCTGGPVPCQAQQKTNDANDPGTEDCFPDSVYMALFGMQAEGILPSPLNLSWDRVRGEMRKQEPDPGQPVGVSVALSLVQPLTSNNAAADLVQTTDTNWKEFLSDQLAAGYPVATQMLSWVLAGSSYHANHSIVVTDVDDASVYYIDPWDGAAHSMSVGDFATAWRGSGWYAVTFSTQSLGADAPAAPTPQALLPDQTVNVGWQGNGAQYQAEIWTQALNRWSASDWISQTSWTSSFTPDPSLVWRVRARSAAGVIGPWSLPGPVVAGTESPAPADSASPAFADSASPAPIVSQAPAAVSAAPPQVQPPVVSSGSFYLSATAPPWTTVSVTVQTGDQVTISSSGTYGVAGSDPGKTPASVGCSGGTPSGYSVPAPDLQIWGLIGRIGNSGAFCIGDSVSFVATTSGTLYVTFNDDVVTDNWGGVTVNWQVSHQP